MARVPRHHSSRPLVTLTLILTAVISACGSENHGLSWIPARGGACGGRIGECVAGEEEYEMASESSRRILATTQYISYGALQRNTVPCSKRGASYYNCEDGAEANPYSRDCSTITRCRS